VKGVRVGIPPILKGYLFLGSSILIGGVFLYTNHLINQMNDQADALSRIFARFCATATVPATESEEVQIIFDEVIQRIDFPVVVTDMEGRPYAWKGVGIDWGDVSINESMAMDPKNPPPGPLTELVTIVERLDSENQPVLMVKPGTQEVFGLVHYGESDFVKQLRWIPFIEIAVIFVFVALGFLAFRSVEVSEHRSIWVGMAKETAHQLGSPISSLMGWLEILRDSCEKKPQSGETGSNLQRSIPQIVNEMESDTERLSKIAQRFSNIGSIPKLEPQDLVPLVAGAVEYFRKRLPREGKRIEVIERYEEVPPANANAELIEWVVENLLKNALDAIDRDSGKIEVSVRRKPELECVEIEVRDNGRGMSVSEQKRIFQTGFSTKKRGWGLGLTLAKRIVEEYHGGRVWVRESKTGVGTAIAVSMPV
jgi:signal transduction histidine kinase